MTRWRGLNHLHSFYTTTRHSPFRTSPAPFSFYCFFYSSESTAASTACSCCIGLTSLLDDRVYPSEPSRICPPPMVSLRPSTSSVTSQYRLITWRRNLRLGISPVASLFSAIASSRSALMLVSGISAALSTKAASEDMMFMD